MDPSTLPLICWQFAIIQNINEQRVLDPVLTFGRQNTLHFFQVTVSSKKNIIFIPLQNIQFQYLLLNFAWLNSRTIVTIDTTEQLHVIDVRTQEELQIIDLAEVHLIYGSSHFKGLANGGNVSKAMSLAGERACYQSVIPYNGHLLLLGTKMVHVMTLRLWDERIDFLVKQNSFAEALALGISFYEDKAKAVVGMTTKKEKKKELIIQKVYEVLNKFVDYTVSNIPETEKLEILEEYFLDVIPICVEHCIFLNLKDLLLEQFFEAFTCNPIAKAIFLESLESHILGDFLPTMPPSIVQQFVEHYEEKELYQELEACVTRMDVATLDLHQVIKICWKHKLYDALLYVYTQGMADYTTPFQDMMVELQKSVQSSANLSDDKIKLGNKLLVYVSFCLAGRTFPSGVIPDEQKEMVKSEMFRIITLIHTRNAPDDEQPYPYLRTLLKFDTRELLNVLALAFEEPEFNKDSGLLQRQRLADILLEIMLEGEEFTPSQIGALFTFLARQMAKSENSIVVNRMLFEQVLEFLTNPSEQESRHEEREQALLELLNGGGLQHYNEERLLQLADKARFYQVCELLYFNRKEYAKILHCYMKDKPRELDTFHYIEQVLCDPLISEDDKLSVEKEIFAFLPDLVRIDNRQTAQIIIKWFCSRIDESVVQLKVDSSVEFAFIEGLIFNSGNTLTDLGTSLQERYIDLMCQLDPGRVADYLRYTDGYKIEETLHIVQQHNIPEATAYLLEKIGDVSGAFKIIFENLQNKVHLLCQHLSSQKAALKESENWKLVQSSLGSAIEFCQRNSFKLDEVEREAIWFPLLEAMMIPIQEYFENLSSESHAVFKEHTHQLLTSMMGYVKLPTIVQKILMNPSYQFSKIGEMKELILGMLDTYNYEKILLTATVNILYQHRHSQLSLLQKTMKKGVSSWHNCCSLCGKELQKNSHGDKIVLFRCGHSFHQSCFQSSFITLTPEKRNKTDTMRCVFCDKSQKSSGKYFIRGRSDSPGSSGASQETSIQGEGQKFKKQSKEGLSPAQLQAYERFRKTMATPSRLAILKDLKDKSSLVQRGFSSQGPSSSHSTAISDFTLNLSPKKSEFLGEY